MQTAGMTRFFLVICLMLTGTAQAVDLASLLKPSAAFKVSVVRLSERSALFTFEVAPGYGLYKDKLAFKSSAGQISPAAVSMVGDAKTKRDELGHVQLRQVNQVRVDFNGPVSGELMVKLQGCADVGLCFNPEIRRLTLP